MSLWWVENFFVNWSRNLSFRANERRLDRLITRWKRSVEWRSCQICSNRLWQTEEIERRSTLMNTPITFLLTSFRPIFSNRKSKPWKLNEWKRIFFLVWIKLYFHVIVYLEPEAIPPITVAMIGVWSRGWIHAMKRNIKPSAAIA